MIDYILIKDSFPLKRELDKDMGASYWVHDPVENPHEATGYTLEQAKAILRGTPYPAGRGWSNRQEYGVAGAVIAKREIKCVITIEDI